LDHVNLVFVAHSIAGYYGQVPRVKALNNLLGCAKGAAGSFGPKEFSQMAPVLLYPEFP